MQPDLQQDVDIRGYDDMPYDYQDMVGVAVGDELVPDIQEKELERIVAVGGGAAGARQDELESEASERVVAAVIRQPRKRAKKATGGKGGGRGRKRRHGVEMLDEKVKY